MEKISLKKLKDESQNYGIKIDDVMLRSFDLYGDFLKEYNKKINLTSIIDDDEIIKKHFLDSVIVKKYIETNNKRIIDIGSGAGFPGVPLKIVDRSIDLSLIDSVKKKTVFLEELKQHLGLDYHVYNKRSEELSRDLDYRESYDIAIARAVSNLKQLAEYSLGLVKPGGYFVAMKGKNNLDLEIEQAQKILEVLGGKILKIYHYNLLTQDNRALIVIKKISKMSLKFPRSTAQIKKK